MPASQFRSLYRVFLRRIVDLELLSAGADTARPVAQFATVVSGISFAFLLPALLLGANPIPRPDAWTPEHFFLALTLSVAGILTVINWDLALPDKRDALILASLPVPLATLVFARVAALFAAPALAVAGLNIFSGLVWPPLFASGHGGVLGYIRVWPAWWIALVAAAVFIICAVLTLQGFAVNLLPRALFLRLSPVLQAVVLCLLLSLFALEPSLESPAALVAPANQHLLAVLPSYWFLGLFEQLNGSADPALLPLAHRAWFALTVSVATAAVTLLLSNLRLLGRVVEQPDLIPARRLSLPPFSRGLSATVLLFGVRTLARNRQHRSLLSVYAGIALAIVVGYSQLSPETAARPSALPLPALVASTLSLLLSVLGLRLLSAIPVTLPANWIARLTELRPLSDYRSAVRRVFLIVGVAPVWLLSALWFAVRSPWRPAAAHLLTLLLLGLALTELCLYRFRKLPFTCSWLPGKANLHLVFWIGLLLPPLAIIPAVTLEGRWLLHPGSTALLLLGLAVFAFVAHGHTERSEPATATLLFDDEPAPILTTLHLH